MSKSRLPQEIEATKVALGRLEARKVFQVGVFCDTERGKSSLGVRRKPLWSAYTMWYNKTWEGCCVHEVEATNGTEAKKIAIKECKLHREKSSLR